MSYLKQALELITAAIPPGSRVALLDEPVHRNIGDHLIHLGTERFFRDHQIVLVARAHVYSYHPRWLRRRLGRETIIVCSGGGHLGDLYPAHQRLRAQVVKDFPHCRVVVLPQSLYFRSELRMREAASVFGNHPDLHLFLRERDSYTRAREMKLDRTYLAPDMVHALHPLDRPAPFAPALGGSLHLLRRDFERSAPAPDAAPPDAALDWPDLVRARDTLALGAVAAVSRMLRTLPPARWPDALLDRRRAALARRGLALLDRYDCIVTSRLHGALLGLLMGKRVRLLPSLTGKAEAYYDTWLTYHGGCEYVPAGFYQRGNRRHQRASDGG